MYSITTNPRLSRVAVSFSGCMEQEHLALFSEVMTAANQMRARNGQWDLLADFLETPVMTQERAQNTTKIFDWCLKNGLRRTAFVMNSVTQRMQMKRVTTPVDTVRYFDNVEEARGWLVH